MEQLKNLVIIIFGASGDLTYRKLIPALYALYNQHLLPDHYRILGVGRTPMSDEAFRKKMILGIRTFSEPHHLDDQQIHEFSGHLSYLPMDMEAVDEYEKLKIALVKMNPEHKSRENWLFYLALPPVMFSVIARNLGEVGINNPANGFKRLVVEKPFGYDLASGLELNRKLHESFTEDQIYRIDHYLGKESVQNLLVMRFANGFFEPLWNRNYVHHIEITSAESIGVENRGRYYDSAGALRDMLQNHLLQILGMISMEPPSSMDSNAIRNEILKVLQSLKPIREEDVEKLVIRGQYLASKVRGEAIRGYREEPGVNSDSRTETYVAMKFFIDNWRWGGVPFYIRTGKRLPTRVTEVVINFKPTPHHLFQVDEIYKSCNQLIIRIQPDEGILLKFGMKVPGAGFKVQPVDMDFHYKDLADVHLPSSYERLLHDAMQGDSTLFARADVVKASWKFVAPIQQAWANNPAIKIWGYPAGTWGPENADDLIDEKEMTWRYPCKNLSDEANYCEL